MPRVIGKKNKSTRKGVKQALFARNTPHIRDPVNLQNKGGIDWLDGDAGRTPDSGSGFIEE